MDETEAFDEELKTVGRMAKGKLTSVPSVGRAWRGIEADERASNPAFPGRLDHIHLQKSSTSAAPSKFNIPPISWPKSYGRFLKPKREVMEVDVRSLMEREHFLLGRAALHEKISLIFSRLDPVQLTQMAKHLETVYVSGWQCSSTASSSLEPGPDLAGERFRDSPSAWY